MSTSTAIPCPAPRPSADSDILSRLRPTSRRQPPLQPISDNAMTSNTRPPTRPQLQWPASKTSPSGTLPSSSSQRHAYLQLLKIILGEASAAVLWDYVGGENINRLESMLCLNKQAHYLMGQGKYMVPHESVTALGGGRKYLLLRYQIIDGSDPHQQHAFL